MHVCNLMLIHALISPRSKIRLFLLASLLVCAGSIMAQSSSGKWDRLEGKKIVNHQGETLGRITDIVVDLENGRYVGVIVPVGGFLGLGAKQQVIPAAALTENRTANTLFLNMDKAKFLAAPTFQMSQEVGPPYAVKVAEVYRYFGQNPYFTTQISATPKAGEKLEQLGYIQQGSRILNMTVENRQGKAVGTVFGFRDLNRHTGQIAGVVLSPVGSMGSDKKIVEPHDLRYNLNHNRLRINNQEQEFLSSPDFTFQGGNNIREDAPQRPGTPGLPLVQGNSERDKRITTEIRNAIVGNSSLSHYGQSIEIGTVNGKTILRGRVQTEEGKNEIAAIAVKAAGRGNVTAMLEVRPMSRKEATTDQPGN